MNGTIEIDNHTGEYATTVRLGNNSTAYVVNSVRWPTRSLPRSVSDNPNVLVSKCLVAARQAAISPLGCWPNTSAVPMVPAR